MALQSHILSSRIWTICEVVVNVLNPIMTNCVLNQSWGNRLFGDAL